MNVLVTGGAGFIGSHVAEELSNMGFYVVSLDDLSGGFIDNIQGNNVHFIKGSINDYELIENLFQKYQFEHIFHLAAYAAEGLSHFIKRFNYENNLIGSINLINAGIKYNVKSFIFTSSIAVYGNNQLPMHEELTVFPEDSYGIAKYAVEQELKITHDMFGMDYVIFRPHNVYGERQNIGDKYRNVIGIFMNQILRNEPITIFGDGEQTRAFTHISDVAPIIAKSILLPEALNQVFNIGSDIHCSINQLASVVISKMGASQKIIHVDARKEVKHVYASHEKLKNIFSPKPPLPLDEGIGRMAEWVKMVGARESQKFKYIEITKNLPNIWQRDT